MKTVNTRLTHGVEVKEVVMTTRNRSKSSSKNSSYSYSYFNKNMDCNGEETMTTPYSGEYESESETVTMADVVTPNYKKRSANGEIINSPMTKVTTTTRDSLLTQIASWHGFMWDEGCGPNGHQHEAYSIGSGTLPSSLFYVDSGDYLAIPTLNQQTLIDSAVNKAFSRVDVSDIQSMVMVAESTKTVASLVSIFKRLVKISRNIKTLRVKQLAQELSGKELADRYMEIRYALRPLMYDAKGTIAALSHKAGEANKRLTFRAGDSDKDQVVDEVVTPWSMTVPSLGTNASLGHDIIVTRESSIEVKVRAGILTALEQLNTLNIWGMTQPVESLWELVPFSFIIDWFVNIGETIAAWTPNYGLTTLSSWYTIETKTYQYAGYSWDNVWTSELSEPYSWGTVQRQVRDCFVDQLVVKKERIPNPSRAILPSFDLRMNALKLADLVIILKKIWG